MNSVYIRRRLPGRGSSGRAKAGRQKSGNSMEAVCLEHSEWGQRWLGLDATVGVSFIQSQLGSH